MPLPIELSVRPLYETLAAGGTSSQDVLIRLDVADIEGRVRPELSAVLVVDTSGSMQGVPIEHVRRGATRLSEILGDADRLGVVRFDDHAEVVSELVTLDAVGRQALARAIDALDCRGCTNMSGGLARALMMFPPERGGRRHVVLLMSDGQANVGVSSPEGLAAETEALRRHGIGTSTLGFGAAHHEDTLIAIADAGGGRYAYVSDPRLADAELARAIGAQRDIVAEGLELILRPAAGVEIVKVLGEPPTSFGADGLRVKLTDAIAGDQINVVVELSIAAPAENGPWRPLEVAVVGTPVGGERARRNGELAVTLSRALALTGNDNRAIDLEVAQFAAIARAGEARDEARALADRGNYAGAAEVLRRARDAVAAAPGFDREAGGALADVYETLIDDITAMENRPDREAYAAYRKAQRGYSDFAAGGIKGRTQTELAGSAAKMAGEVYTGPLPEARLVVSGDGDGEVGDRVMRIDKADVIIGRSRNTDIHIESSSLSRRHTRVKFLEGGFWIFDLGSTNGTVVNGEVVSRPVRLSGGDRITIGKLELVYEIDEE